MHPNDLLPAMPDTITAATTVKLKRSHAHFPASAGWSLKLTLAGKVVVTFASAASGNDHLITMPATGTPATDDLGPGVYEWVEKAVLGGEVYETDRGFVQVFANLEAGVGDQFQQWAEKVVELIEARISGRVIDGADMAAYRIGDREISNIPIDELFGILNTLRAQLRAKAAGGQFARQVVMEFTGRGLRH